MASLNIGDSLQAFAASQAARRGLRSAAEYVEQLLLQTREREQSEVAPLRGPDPVEVAATLAKLDRLRKGNHLNGQSVRELIEEGRRTA